MAVRPKAGSASSNKVAGLECPNHLAKPRQPLANNNKVVNREAGYSAALPVGLELALAVNNNNNSSSSHNKLEGYSAAGLEVDRPNLGFLVEPGQLLGPVVDLVWAGGLVVARGLGLVKLEAGLVVVAADYSEAPGALVVVNSSKPKAGAEF